MIVWALETYKVLVDLVCDPATGVSMIELGQFSRAGKGEIPQWAIRLGARQINSDEVLPMFTYGFTMNVPLMDTTVYLDYLANRFLAASGDISENVHLEKLEDISPEFDLIVNCAGVGAKTLVPDVDLEPHRGQVVIVPKIDNLSCAIVCDDPPLMRSRGGTIASSGARMN